MGKHYDENMLKFLCDRCENVVARDHVHCGTCGHNISMFCKSCRRADFPTKLPQFYCTLCGAPRPGMKITRDKNVVPLKEVRQA